LLGFVAIIGVITFRGCSMAITDRTEFQYDHNLPHAYEGHMQRNLAVMQSAAVAYAYSHQGRLPPMQSPAATLTALLPILGHDAEYRTQNPATQTPFTPNAALSGQKTGAISHGGTAILFYDADPTAGYRESYYVTIKGVIGHVPVSALPNLLTASRKE